MRGRIALEKHFVRNVREGLAYFAKALGVRTPPRVDFLAPGKDSRNRFPESSTGFGLPGARDEHGNIGTI
jgi:hypothetical protein